MNCTYKYVTKNGALKTNTLKRKLSVVNTRKVYKNTALLKFMKILKLINMIKVYYSSKHLQTLCHAVALKPQASNTHKSCMHSEAH